MKYFLLSLLLLTSFSASLSAQDFIIRGKMEGLRKGVSISVLKQELPLDYDAAKSNAEADAMKGGEVDPMQYVEVKTIASAYVEEDGVFELRGHIDRPQLVTMITNNLEFVEREYKDMPDTERYKHVHWTYTPIFLDNEEYTISASKYEMLTNEPITDDCVITGGEAQADFNEYNRMKNDMEFIETHPASVVSVYLADNMLTNGYNLTSEQIQHLESCITGCPIDPLRYERFVTRAKLAERTATGSPVIDLSLATPEGAPRQLTSILPKSKYLLLDFWASWCGICRAGTPRVKEIYRKYTRDQFEVISISCDTSLDRWKTAMAKDCMPWAQYILTPQGYQDFFAKYQASGVPYLLLLDADGKVIANPESPEKVHDILAELMP